jgi:hypothetical protein
MTFLTPEKTAESEVSRIILDAERHEIYAIGDIENDTAQKFETFVAKHSIKRARVHFVSGGGSLLGSMLFGLKIRELGFETEISGPIDKNFERTKAICASACAYAFAGGVHRFYSDQTGALGLHQFFSTGSNGMDSSEAQQMSALILRYLDEMGVDASAFRLASETTSDEMAWVSTEDAVSMKLADNGVEPTTAEIKLSEGWPYLRLNQNHNDFTARVLVYCFDGEFHLASGIVTTPALSRDQAATFGTSYLYFDDTQFSPVSQSRGHEAVDSTIWIERPLNRQGLSLLQNSQRLGIWLNNGGAFQWGAHMDLTQVRTQIRNFVSNCNR